MVPNRSAHHSLAENLKRRVLDGLGETDPLLRQRVAARVAGGPPLEPPFDDLARQIGEAAYGATDAQVAAVRTATGSDKAAFEIVATAAVAAGLLRWEHAVKALTEAENAPT